MTKEELDQAVTDFIVEGRDELMVTGWVLSAVVKHSSNPGMDGYIVEHSDGMPYHSQLGLLAASLDEKKNHVLNQVIKEG